MNSKAPLLKQLRRVCTDACKRLRKQVRKHLRKSLRQARRRKPPHREVQLEFGWSQQR